VLKVQHYSAKLTAVANDVNIPSVVARVRRVQRCFAQDMVGAIDVNIPTVVARVLGIRLCFAQHMGGGRRCGHESGCRKHVTRGGLCKSHGVGAGV
jgi:hypothetical protein